MTETISLLRPNCPGLNVGDFMPEEWSVIPANKMALDEMNDFVDFTELWSE